MSETATIRGDGLFGDNCYLRPGTVLSINSVIGCGSVISEDAFVEQGRKIPEKVVVAGVFF